MPRPTKLEDWPEGVRVQARAQLDAQAAAATARMLALLHAGKGVKPPLAVAVEAPKRPWSAAKRTVVDGIAFPSRMEARVYARLKAELLPGETLLRQVRMPLLSIAPGERGVPLALTVDFAIFKTALRKEGGAWSSIGCRAGWVRWIEAKGLRKSRDWARGKAAFEAAWGKIEEVDR